MNNENNNAVDLRASTDALATDLPFMIQYPVRSGAVISFDASPKACEIFGFFSGERVQVRGGRTGWVIGVRDNNLFFHIDGDKGASYYNNYSKQNFMNEGFKLVSPRYPRSTFGTSNNSNDDSSSNNQPVHNASAFKALVGDPLFSDVSFQVGNKTIAAHKNILVTRSQYFRAMFTGGMRENKESVIALPNMEPDTFTSVLEFIYTGHVTLDEHNVVPLIHAAAIFGIEDLRELCLTRFGAVVTIQNVVSLLLVADSHNENQLKLSCQRFIMEHYNEMLLHESFKLLIAPENAELLLQIMTQLSPNVISPTSSPANNASSPERGKRHRVAS